MKKKIIHLLDSPTFLNIIASFVAVIVGLIFGFLILLISNPSQAIYGFMTIIFGGFSNGIRSIGQVIYFATPIIFTGLSVGFAFKSGLFNIGASGQFIVGAFTAVYVAITCTWLDPSIHWMVAILAAFLAGALWALVPGVLNAYLNVNEVISTIMMNYIGMYLVNLLVVKTVFDPLKNQSQNIPEVSLVPKMGMDVLFKGSSAGGGFFIAIIVAIIIFILLEKTTLGFELKACGLNRNASKYAGISEKRSIILSMTIAGALAGLGGGLFYLAGSGKHIDVVDVLANEGFMGIPVALLGFSHPIGIVVAGLFIAYMNVGGFYMQIYDFTPEVIDIIIAAIIYFSAFSLIFKKLTISLLKKLIREK